MLGFFLHNFSYFGKQSLGSGGSDKGWSGYPKQRTFFWPNGMGPSFLLSYHRKITKIKIFVLIILIQFMNNSTRNNDVHLVFKIAPKQV